MIKRLGFTIIEIMVVMALIGVITAVFLPRIIRRPVRVEWPVILDDLNNIVSFARQEAMASQTVHRLVFYSVPQGLDFVVVEDEHDDPEKHGRKVYRQVQSYYFPTRYEFADAISLKAVYLGRKNILEDSKHGAACYIVPDGLVQEVVVQLERKINAIQTGSSYVMNPFAGKFELHDGFTKIGY